ncbi:MAG TPA: NAD-glutamate dehydrogenase, partial [Beijerinckiaceae bacterium]|nr:NAD-glutamate dehydrogenase [Beijerinckiaceae bacterium]
MNEHQSFGSFPPIAAPAEFANALFGRTAREDLQFYGAAQIAALAELAWLHLSAPREPGRPSLRMIDPERANPRLDQIVILEVVNDDMPFLLDSTLAELADQGLDLRLVAHPVFAVERDETGRLSKVYLDPANAPAQARRESLIHIHLGRFIGKDQRAELVRALEIAYGEVRLAVRDGDAMVERVADEVQAFRTEPPILPADELAEAVQFLEWILADNFIFLGQRVYRFAETAPDGVGNLESVPNSGLGILRDPEVSVLRRGRELVAVTPEVLEFLHDQHVLIIAKANVKSRVHRHVHMDYIGVKQFDSAGRLLGELRIVGLFTPAAYTRSAQSIPYIRHKVARVLELAHLDRDSHFGRVLADALETYPRDEVFQMDVPTLTRFASDIAALQERPRLRILARVDRFDRFVSVLAFLPRDRYDTRVQTLAGAELARIYDGRVSAVYPFYPEGPLVRVHYIIGRYEGRTPQPSRESVEAAISAVTRTWSDALRDALFENHGAAGHILATR